MQDRFMNWVHREAEGLTTRQGKCSKCRAKTDELIVFSTPGSIRWEKAPALCRACVGCIIDDAYTKYASPEKKCADGWRSKNKTVGSQHFENHVRKRIVDFRCACGVHVGYLRHGMSVQPSECRKCAARSAIRRHQIKHGKGTRQATCAECGGSFEAKRNTATFCSTKCRVAAARADSPARAERQRERAERAAKIKARKAEYDAYWNGPEEVSVKQEWLGQSGLGSKRSFQGRSRWRFATAR